MNVFKEHVPSAGEVKLQVGTKALVISSFQGVGEAKTIS